jgi:hypothetical protein
VRLSHVPVLALLLASPAVAAEPAVRVPSAAPIPAPMPPKPAPAPAGGPLTLSAGVWFVVDSDVPVIVLSSPAGLVSVTEDAGPLRFRGRFVEEPEKLQTRTFSGKHVFTVEAVASGRVEILVVPVGAKGEKDVIRRTVDVDAGQGPIPPPKPKPDPEPKPDPKPLPVAWVVVVEETEARTEAQAALLNDTAYWQSLASSGVKWRFYDKDSPDVRAKGFDRASPVPYVLLLDARGRDAATGGEPRPIPLPADKAGVDALLKGQ